MLRKLTVIPMYSTFPFLYSAFSGEEVTDAYGRGWRWLLTLEVFLLQKGRPASGADDCLNP